MNQRERLNSSSSLNSTYGLNSISLILAISSSSFFFHLVERSLRLLIHSSRLVSTPETFRLLLSFLSSFSSSSLRIWGQFSFQKNCCWPCCFSFSSSDSSSMISLLLPNQFSSMATTSSSSGSLILLFSQFLMALLGCNCNFGLCFSILLILTLGSFLPTKSMNYYQIGSILFMLLCWIYYSWISERFPPRSRREVFGSMLDWLTFCFLTYRAYQRRTFMVLPQSPCEKSQRSMLLLPASSFSNLLSSSLSSRLSSLLSFKLLLSSSCSSCSSCSLSGSIGSSFLFLTSRSNSLQSMVQLGSCSLELDVF